VAIVQISRITNRKGLQENLPQLAGAELGWSIDSRRLYIGNGTLEEGAPVIGNTEILTEFSEILPPPTVVELQNNIAAPTPVLSQDANTVKTFSVTYSIVRDTTYRTGTLTVVAGSISGPVSYNDSFLENAATGISLSVTQIDSTINVNYISTNTGLSATMYYSVNTPF
jgi:hypothetical protein